jgi:hypothetical protein
MADYFYMYGNDLTQDIDEAQRDIIAAFDLLIVEMRDYMRRNEKSLGITETDEFQMLWQQTSMRIHASINETFGESKEFEPRNLEADKQRVRDENTAKLGGYEKRLNKLLRLRSIFTETDPEQVEQSPVHYAYRIFKIQVMRCATEFNDPLASDVSKQLIKLCTYRNALLSCCRLDERWDDHEVFPFVDAEV